jgi:hypothetical protein
MKAAVKTAAFVQSGRHGVAALLGFPALTLWRAVALGHLIHSKERQPLAQLQAK